MQRAREHEVVCTGGGVICSIASSMTELGLALREGQRGVQVLPPELITARGPRVAARVQDFDHVRWLEEIETPVSGIWKRARKVLHNATRSTRLGAVAAVEAWRDARLDAEDPALGAGTGIIVAGSNLSQDYMAENLGALAASERRVNPKFAVSYSDSNQVGCLSQMLGVRGPGMTVGAASASGNAALFQAWHWVRAGVVERCVVVGAASVLSPVELEAFGILGAASLTGEASAAPRPFDKGHDGFVWGEAAAAVVLESGESARRRSVSARGRVLGVSLLLDARHGPEPVAAAEVQAMRAALAAAGVSAQEIDYVNAHGTGSPAGDRAECEALREVFGLGPGRPRINATKALLGHGLSSAGLVELLACLLQVEGGFLHGNPNLVQPIDAQLSLVAVDAESSEVRLALSNSFGFGGFNSSLVISAP
ncbi:MAG: hypothetical protein J6386_26030 [Candidatus Synoicihabitans palmerolidicus]|nr:hypothetical protein [Candidatus Synoicihabitans palmerolidicus]MCC5025191.1 hypothetical protein [Candidatus Synoicihabitans palmerolidicus]MCC5025740.1 hypothetical protein [Candidatus Synoicihabitans palmerolidicus]MCC5025869.1 hypothetical protein [Candidatus Synoicihabitans palmerolidicus]MCC5025882.1 hypothetical protein [Candidatus Synoicihabitans palmerolidicus]